MMNAGATRLFSWLDWVGVMGIQFIQIINTRRG